LDFRLKPFNRHDVYSFNVFLVLKGGKKPGEMQFSSSHSIRFVDLPSVGDFTGKMVLEVFRLLLWRR